MRNEAKDVKLETKKNCGCGQDPCVTFGKKELTQAQKVDEALVEPKDGVDSAKEVRKATRKAAFRPFNKEEVQVDEANKAERIGDKYSDRKLAHPRLQRGKRASKKDRMTARATADVGQRNRNRFDKRYGGDGSRKLNKFG